MRKNALDESEKLYILEHIRIDAVSRIAKDLGRDPGTVIRFLQKEGIKYENRGNKPLTEKEKQYILSHYTTMGHKAIAKKLKRGPSTILDFYHVNGHQSAAARFVGLTGDPAANGVIYDAMELASRANALRKQCRTQAKKEKRE